MVQDSGTPRSGNKKGFDALERRVPAIKMGFDVLERGVPAIKKGLVPWNVAFRR